MAALLLLALAPVALGADHVLISEFMAANQDTLRDGNGSASDWIELFNAGDAPVNLAGWHLTDDPLNLSKWTFPGATLGPGQFLVVFASGLGVPDLAGNLHANFSLNAGGEYLALVRSDGSTIASGFAPAFPSQRSDVAYGLAQQQITTLLLGAGSTARLRVPTATDAAQIGSTWTGLAESFNDSTWLNVSVPIGFDTPPRSATNNLANVAQGKPVMAAGEQWGGLPKENLTDGNLLSFTHNLAQVPDFYFIVDLGGTYQLENIELFNRADGCCPERLSNFTVSLHADTGATPGPAVWSANVRTNGSNSGVGGRDLITPNLDTNGTFAGRWIKVSSRPSSGPRYFQIAELRAHAANWAQGAAVFASGPTRAGFPASNLTDTNLATVSHNLDLANVFSYQIRLSQAVAVARVELWNRNDGCCPERLSNYRVTLHPDLEGSMGPAVWSADLHTDNSSSGVGGLDALAAVLDPAGSFEGQWVQIQNLDNGSARYLQLAEVRVFGTAGSSGYGALVRSDVTTPMKTVNASAWLRVPFTVTGATNLDAVMLRLKRDDGFVAWVNGVEAARRNAPAGPPAYNAAATGPHFAAATEEFPIPPGLLRDGANILALHGLNLTAADGDFLLAPELSATTINTASYGYLLAPTPGAVNSSNIVASFVDDPRFSLDRGFFDAPIVVVITNPTPGAALVYTTNASLPALTNGVVLLPSSTNASITTTVRVSTTTILRATAFKAGLQPSHVDTHTYLFLSNVIQQPSSPPGFPATWNGFAADYQMDPEVVTNADYRAEIVGDLRGIRTLSIVVNPSDLFGPVNGIYTFSDQVGDAWERPASIELINPDGSSAFQENCGMRIWGTGWRPHGSSPKHAIQLKFQDQYGSKKLHYPLFPDAPVTEFDNLVLRAQGSRSWCDSRSPDIEQTQYIHDSWARDTRRDMGATDGHASYFHLYLNGLYWGLYNPVEKTDDGWAETYYGGDKSDYDVITRRGAPEVDAGDLNAWNAMMTIVNAGLATPEQYALLQQYLDVDDFIDYMMLNQYASNHDGPLNTIGNNMRAIRRRAPGAQFRFHVWDMEYTFWYPLEYNLAFDLDQCPARIFQRLRANPEFRLRFADHAQRHLLNNGALTPGPAAARWRARADEIQGAIVGESARWGDVRRATPYTRNVEWTNELNRLLYEYFPVRAQVLLGQYQLAALYPNVAAPSFNQPGGEVQPGFILNLSASAGTVCFTTDGSDPRLAGGGVSPNAVTYRPATPLVTTATTARVFIPGNDSLARSWTGGDPNFNDLTWLQGTNAVGFDVTAPPAPITVPLMNATADFSESGRGINLAIDAQPLTTGWGVFENQSYLPKGRGAVAVFETITNLGYAEGTKLTFTLRHGLAGGNGLGKFRLSVTTDDRGQFADGLINRGDVLANWTVLQPLTAASSGGSTITINPDGTLLATGANPSTDAYTVTAITSLAGLTGFRLEAMEDSALPNSGPGRAANGNAVLTDFVVQAAPATLTPLLDTSFAAQIRAAMQNINSSAYLRLPFNTGTGAVFHHLTLRVRYQDGFVAYLNGVEAARRNAPAAPAWNSAATMDRPKGQALEFEEIDLTPALASLANGPGVLAFHAFNTAAANPAFLIQAELIAKTDRPLALADSTTVRARTLLNGEWSALNEATFIARVPLRFTEIMYNPPGAGFVSGDEFEFVELKNTGTVAFNLGGLAFTSGIGFTFTNGTVLAPGQFLVLAANAAQFAARHPGVTVGGVYSGKLDNGGETLTLARPLNGGTVLSVTYGDSAPWPAAPDGFGFSLVPKNPLTNPDPDHGANWRASGNPFGSPGADDPDPAIAPLLVNEILSASVPPDVDAIELFNPTANTVNLGGWFLTDDRAQPKKFRIPGNTMISAGGFLVFDEDDFNPSPGATNSFSINSAGDSVYLFSGDASTNLTGYSHGFAFAAGAPGVTFGRHLISTGEEQFPAQSGPTLNAPNAGPRLGPVVVSEIMYHPPPGGDEFIELKNITETNVALFDPAHVTNTWNLGGVNYALPGNVTLAANSFLLIVGIDPATFRAKYGVAPQVQILGPYLGQLQDSGERMELRRPLLPDTNGVPYVTVDEVRYNDRAPWPPLADGFGPSLQRLDANAYGNDPAHWRAAAPSPGADFAGGVAPAITLQPANQTAVRFQNAMMNVGASGTAPIQYQWQFNGTNLAFMTNAFLLLNNVQPADAGGYRATVFNPAGVATSAVALLTVLIPPIISSQPRGSTNGAASSVTFTVSATGSGALTYQWRIHGTNIPGATGSSLTLANLQEPQSGDYFVVVTDSIGSSTSQPATLLVLTRPVITAHPQSVVAVAGDTVTFRVSCDGTLPLYYRWRGNGVTLTNIPLYSHTSALTLVNVQTNTAANYTVTITNALAPGAGSQIAVLTVHADADGDHVPDWWETQYGFSPTNPADGSVDSDGDGMTNAEEYLAGTNPTNELSYLKIDSLALGAGALITFSAVSNRTYTVQFTDRLRSPAMLDWSRLADFPARATNRTEVALDPGSTTNRFYRLATPQPPLE